MKPNSSNVLYGGGFEQGEDMFFDADDMEKFADDDTLKDDLDGEPAICESRRLDPARRACILRRCLSIDCY